MTFQGSHFTCHQQDQLFITRGPKKMVFKLAILLGIEQPGDAKGLILAYLKGGVDSALNTPVMERAFTSPFTSRWMRFFSVTEGTKFNPRQN